MKPLSKFAPRFLGVLILILLVAPGAFAVQQAPGITGVEIRPEPNEIELTTLGSLEFGFFPLSDPDRLVFDFPGTSMTVNDGNTVTRAVSGACFDQIRLSQFSKDPPIARLVIYLRQAAKAQADYNAKSGKLVIRVVGEKTDLLAKPVKPAVDSNTTARPTEPARSSAAQPTFTITPEKDEIIVRFAGIDADNITVKQFRFPDRLRIRLFSKGTVEGALPRFDQKDKGNIWNGIGKRWVSYVDRDNLGITELTLYLYDHARYTQSINADGSPEVRITRTQSDTGLGSPQEKPASKEKPGKSPSEIEVFSNGGKPAPDTSKASGGTVKIKPGEVEIIKSIETIEKIDNGTFIKDAPASTGQVKKPSEPIKIGEPVTVKTSKAPATEASDTTAKGEAQLLSKIGMRVGEVFVIKTEKLIRASIGNPAVATLNVISQDQILLTALLKGTTTLVLWENGKGYSTREVNVLDATAAREEEIKAIINDPNISVKIAMQGDNPGIILEGSVRSEEQKDRAAAIAALYTGSKEKVTNLLEVTDPRQVMVKVRVVEMDKRALDEHLSQFSASARADNGDFTIGLITDMLDPDNPGGGLMDTRVKPGIVNGNVKDIIFDPIDAMLNELETHREASILSEPNVIAMSGHEAHFRVGGEVPYTFKNENGFNVVEFKEFGIVLDMKPEVDSQGNIKMHIAPTVRTIDMALAISGIPGFRTREMKTDVQMRPGETLVIGGLIQHEITKVVSEIPLLSQIPVLGQLFRSKRFNNDETELVIFLTPYIIKEPADASAAVKIDPKEVKKGK